MFKIIYNIMDRCTIFMIYMVFPLMNFLLMEWGFPNHNINNGFFSIIQLMLFFIFGFLYLLALHYLKNFIDKG